MTQWTLKGDGSPYQRCHAVQNRAVSQPTWTVFGFYVAKTAVSPQLSTTEDTGDIERNRVCSRLGCGEFLHRYLAVKTGRHNDLKRPLDCPEGRCVDATCTARPEPVEGRAQALMVRQAHHERVYGRQLNCRSV